MRYTGTRGSDTNILKRNSCWLWFVSLTRPRIPTLKTFAIRAHQKQSGVSDTSGTIAFNMRPFVPAGGLMDVNLVERKVSFGKAETKLDEAAISSTFRAGGGFIDRNFRHGLPDFATP